MSLLAGMGCIPQDDSRRQKVWSRVELEQRLLGVLAEQSKKN